MQNKPVKRPLQLIDEENSVRPIDASLVKRPFWPAPQQMICGYCLKPGHIQHNCWKGNKLCLSCGSDDHSIGDYPFKRTWNTTPAPLVLPTPPLRRNPEPIARKAPLLPQQHDQSQREPRARADRGRGQVYNFSTEEAEAPNVVIAGQWARCSEQETWGCHRYRYPNFCILNW